VPIVQVAVLSVWLATGGHPAATARIVLLALSAFAMGVQSAGVNTLPLTGVATTYLTGTLTTLTTELAPTGVPAAMRRRFAVLAAALAGAGLNAALFTWLHPAARRCRSPPRSRSSRCSPVPADEKRAAAPRKGTTARSYGP
jgi:uncharacterized membrane protein YoaK (UPF0700 family)